MKIIPKVGYTLAIDPYDNQFQTQPITEIIDLTDKIIHFLKQRMKSINFIYINTFKKYMKKCQYSQ